MDVLLFEVNHTTAGMVHTNVMMVLQDSDNLLIVNPMGLVSEDLIGTFWTLNQHWLIFPIRFHKIRYSKRCNKPRQ